MDIVSGRHNKGNNAIRLSYKRPDTETLFDLSLRHYALSLLSLLPALLLFSSLSSTRLAVHCAMHVTEAAVADYLKPLAHIQPVGLSLCHVRFLIVGQESLSGSWS